MLAVFRPRHCSTTPTFIILPSTILPIVALNVSRREKEKYRTVVFLQSNHFTTASFLFFVLLFSVSSVKLNLAKMMEQKEKAVSNLTRGIDLLFKKNKVRYRLSDNTDAHSDYANCPALSVSVSMSMSMSMSVSATVSVTAQITRFTGVGKIVSPTSVQVANPDGKSEVVEAQNIVIATGSDSFAISGLEFDEKTIVSSTGALGLSQVPKKMVVIGGGVIGLELVRQSD